MLPELRGGEETQNPINHEYSSADDVMSGAEVTKLLSKHKLMPDDRFEYEEDMLA